MIGLFKRYVVHNFSFKLMSLIFATALWFMISRDDRPAELAVRAPIVFQNVPSELEISSESVPEALIRVRGPERVIRQLRSNDVQAVLDLSGSKAEARTFDLTAQQVDHPRDVSVVQVVPSQLRLSFDTRLSREVEVHPRVTGNFASGDQIVRIDADPPRITISGPRHHVEKIDAAITDPIDASGTLGSAVFTTNAYVADPLVQVAQGTSIRVTVVVEKLGAPTTH
jgi:YbbR domain-containing protein